MTIRIIYIHFLPSFVFLFPKSILVRQLKREKHWKARKTLEKNIETLKKDKMNILPIEIDNFIF